MVPVTVGAVLADATARLRLASTSPRLDAEVLLAHVLRRPRSLLAADDAAVAAGAQAAFDQFVVRRARGEPVAYLTGTREFWSLELKVTPDVLIPRPETELLVEWGLERLQTSFRRKPESSVSVLDIGTGSGAIALAIAKECPQLRVIATDVSAAALDVARANASRLGIRTVEFLEGDFFKALDARFRGHDEEAAFDLIVSNPPYVAEGDPHLADLRFEPAAALTAGADGLSALRTIIGGAAEFLEPDGWLLLEHGADQAEAVRRLFENSGFLSIETRRDLAGHERATGGRRD